MEKLEGYNSRLKRLSELVAQLESGELDLDGLSEMESITRELHERSIILRYNAFKDHVSDDDSDATIDEDGGVEVEVVIEEIEPEVEPEPEAEGEPTIDFSIFDDEPEVESEAKDIEPVEMNEVEPEIIPEPKVEVVEPEPEVKAEEPKVEEPKVEVVEPEAKDEELKIEEPVGMTPESFLDKLSIEDNSLATRFSASKLDTLIGAFGLNQRLRYINDLFDGSSEVFSDAIKALDTQSSLNEAKQKAAQLATDHEWDPEEEIVIEFMSFVSRRYA